MGAANSLKISSKKGLLSPRTIKRRVSDFILTSPQSPEQVSVVKSPSLYDNEILSDEEADGFLDHCTPVSPNALSWMTETTPSTIKYVHCDADAYKILSGREDSITVSEVSISRPNSPKPELQLSLSPRSDLGEEFFPPTPRESTPRSRTGTICTPTDVRRLSATQNFELNLQMSPKGARLSRRGGLCAFHDHQVPESIRSIRIDDQSNGGGPCPEEEQSASRRRVKTIRFDWTPRPIESTSSESLFSPNRILERSRTDYHLEYMNSNLWRRRSIVPEGPSALNVGGSRIPF